jgi:hypothetical protein
MVAVVTHDDHITLSVEANAVRAVHASRENAWLALNRMNPQSRVRGVVDQAFDAFENRCLLVSWLFLEALLERRVNADGHRA